ncbi:hypothetical protein ES332_A01G203800v1 [Gossypium tomentosum]|uniref:Coiled-coil domain-containing protein n=1 Tax=Gossypium tomentosum TaxID=34277 RepID=A0A5D2RVK0_GOSTO|nr:hypothetical protein ES332_A01G203800v1 [Gossypium tomentosum]
METYKGHSLEDVEMVAVITLMTTAEASNQLLTIIRFRCPTQLPEEKEIEKVLKKPDKKANRVAIPVPKVTEAELQKEEEEQAEEAKKRQSRTVAEVEYERLVSVTNTNRDDSLIEARSVQEAIAQMSVADNLPPDRHTERWLKASFKAFEEAELPRLKEEKPGLTHNQYKDMIWKLWKKSPDNPLNQVAE